MGFLSNLANLAFQGAEGLFVSSVAINILIQLIGISSYIPPSALSQIESMSLVGVLASFLHNTALQIGAETGVVISGVLAFFNLNQQIQSVIGQVAFTVFITFLEGNFTWFVEGWLVPFVNSANLVISPQIDTLLTVATGAVDLLLMLYYLMALGYIPQNL